MINIQNNTSKEIDSKFAICPKCGENTFDIDYQSKAIYDRGIRKIIYTSSINILRKYKHKNLYTCLHCNTKWESPFYYNNTQIES